MWDPHFLRVLSNVRRVTRTFGSRRITPVFPVRFNTSGKLQSVYSVNCKYPALRYRELADPSSKPEPARKPAERFSLNTQRS